MQQCILPLGRDAGTMKNVQEQAAVLQHIYIPTYVYNNVKPIPHIYTRCI